MKLFSGSGSRVNHSRNNRGSENRGAHSSHQARSSTYNGAIWEEDEPRVVKADSSTVSTSHRSVPREGYTLSPSYSQPDFDYPAEEPQQLRSYSHDTPDKRRKLQKKQRESAA